MDLQRRIVRIIQRGWQFDEQPLWRRQRIGQEPFDGGKFSGHGFPIQFVQHCRPPAIQNSQMVQIVTVVQEYFGNIHILLPIDDDDLYRRVPLDVNYYSYRSTIKYRCWSMPGVSYCCSAVVTGRSAVPERYGSAWASPFPWTKPENWVWRPVLSACWTSHSIWGVCGWTGTNMSPWKSSCCCRRVNNK